MNINFQKHLLQVQTKEMVKYIGTLENNNTVMLQFIQQNGLGEEFQKLIEPKEEKETETSEEKEVI